MRLSYFADFAFDAAVSVALGGVVVVAVAQVDIVADNRTRTHRSVAHADADADVGAVYTAEQQPLLRVRARATQLTMSGGLAVIANS